MRGSRPELASGLRVRRIEPILPVAVAMDAVLVAADLHR